MDSISDKRRLTRHGGTLAPSVCIALFTAAGAFVRFWRLDATPISGDEAFSWRIAEFPLTESLQRVALDTTPPLHFMAEALWISLFGDSLWALRGLSAIAGCAAVPLVYCLVAEPCGESTRRLLGVDLGAITSCALMALHPFELEYSRVARMYSLGMLLTVLSTWFLLKAIDADGARSRSRLREKSGRGGRCRPELSRIVRHTRDHRAEFFFCGYSLSAAALCLCHHFAALTVAAQLIAAACTIVWLSSVTKDWTRAASRLTGAAVLLVCLYSPWISPAVAQFKRVRADFWLPPRTASEVVATAGRWALGNDSRRLAPVVLVATGGLFLAFAAACGTWRTRLFWLMTVIPWAGAVMVGQMAGRPLIEARYFAFAHVSLICLVGSALNAMKWTPARVVAAASLVLLCLHGASEYVAAFPRDHGALDEMADYLRARCGAGDVIIAPQASTLLRLRYAMRDAGGDEIAVKVRWDPSTRGGHVNHVAALRADEMLPAFPERGFVGFNRLFAIERRGVPLKLIHNDWTAMERRQFRRYSAGGVSDCIVTCYRPREHEPN